MKKKMIIMIALAIFGSATYAQSSFEDKKVEFEVFAGVSLNDNVGKDVDGTKMKVGFHAGFTGRYNIMEGLFAEGAVAFATKGFKAETSSTSGKGWIDNGLNYDSEMETNLVTYNIDVPISIGYRFSVSDNFKVRIKAGPYLTYALFGESKQKGKTTYYPDIHSGETERVDRTVKLSDMDDYKKFGVGVQGGVGFEYNQVTLSATYQRGLTSLDKHADIFEQNILISLGFKF